MLGAPRQSPITHRSLRHIPLRVCGAFVFLGSLACGGLGGPSRDFSGPHTATIQALDISPDGSLVATGAQDRTTRVWRLPGLEGVRELPDEGFVGAVAFSPDGRRVATGGRGPEVVVWDTGSWGIVGRIPRSVASLDWAADRIVLAVQDSATVEVWHASTYELESTFTGHIDDVHAVRLSNDGNRVASGGKDHAILLWDSATGEELGVFAGHSGVVLTLAFSPDGRMIASGASDKTTRIWEIETQEPVRQQGGHADRVTGVEFSPDGTTLATVGRDGALRHWDVATGDPLDKVSVAEEALTSLRFDGDQHVVVAGDDVSRISVKGRAAGQRAGSAPHARALDDRCSRLVTCGKSLIREKQTNERGVALVRMARELDVDSPEICLTTLMSVGSVIGAAPPADCLVTD